MNFVLNKNKFLCLIVYMIKSSNSYTYIERISYIIDIIALITMKCGCTSDVSCNSWHVHVILLLFVLENATDAVNVKTFENTSF